MKSYLLAALFGLGFVGASSAGTVVIPYSGSFDEASVLLPQDGLPAGDVDTLGGLADVAQFNLLAGVNTFIGSIESPDDPSDSFLISIGPGLELIGATINWGTNLPGLDIAFPPPAGYLVQMSGGPGPSWTLEENSATPTIFNIADLFGSFFGQSPETYDAPSFSRGPGLYSSTIRNESTVCAGSYAYDGQFLTPYCVEAMDYTMSFIVRSTETKPEPQAQVPLPSVAILLGGGLLALGASQRKRRSAI